MRVVSHTGYRWTYSLADAQRFLLATRVAGEALSHDALLTRVWGNEYRYETQYLKVYVGRLRDKIETDAADPKLIQTVRGVGYRFARPDE